MKKLKDLLNESYAWERKPGKPLPTLSEVQAEHERKLQEKTEYEVAGRPVTLNKNGSEKQADWSVTFKNGQTKQYHEVASLLSPRPKLQPRWWDSDGDGKPYEPGDDVKEIKEGRGDYNILDLVSTAEDLVQNLRSNMATNSVLQREEKMGYLKAYDELLDVLSDIGYQAEMNEDVKAERVNEAGNYYGQYNRKRSAAADEFRKSSGPPQPAPEEWNKLMDKVNNNTNYTVYSDSVVKSIRNTTTNVLYKIRWNGELQEWEGRDPENLSSLVPVEQVIAKAKADVFGTDVNLGENMRRFGTKNI